MLKETGRIVALDGDGAWVETLRESACGACTARGGCGHGLLNSAKPGSSRALVRARLPDGLGQRLAVHDRVELSLPEGSFLRAAALLYLLPLFAALAAALAGNVLLVPTGTSGGRGDLTVSLCAAAGLLLGLGAVRVLTRRVSQAGKMEPLVTARL
jgi:sigma-E factor negative regulatory protein RseC